VVAVGQAAKVVLPGVERGVRPVVAGLVAQHNCRILYTDLGLAGLGRHNKDISFLHLRMDILTQGFSTFKCDNTDVP
jgi:hypothetical protein